MWLLFFVFLLPLCANNAPLEEIVAFRKEEELIAGIVSPLTGHIVQKNIDLTIYGKEPLHFSHSYLPYHINSCASTFERFFQPWIFAPHLCVLKKERFYYITNPNGHTLPYYIKKGKASLHIPSLKFTNTDGHEIGARFDPHNIHYSKLSDEIFCMWGPDGTKRLYKSTKDGLNFLLQSETLPNGKHIRYLYNKNKELSSIETTDPSESVVYGRITLSRSDDGLSAYAQSSDGKCVFYKGKENFHFKDKKAGFEYSLTQLATVSSPLYPQEVVECQGPCLLGQSGRGRDFYVSYEKDGRVSSLYVRTEGDAYSLYKFSYGLQKTVVTYPEGNTSEHLFTTDFQPERISFYDPDGVLRREKRYIWEENGRLKGLEETGLSRTEYTSDEFGNPVVETFIGDLEGHGKEESYTVKRTFSGKDPSLWFLLLTEESEEATTNYSYVRGTNLLLLKVVQGKDGVVLKEQRDYDKYLNLIAITSEGDGQKRITRIHPKTTSPALHQPEWVEELYVENGEEKLLKKSRFYYNRHNLVFREDLHGSDGAFAYFITKDYSHGDLLLSETNPLGQKAHYSYDKENRLISSIPFSEKLKEDMTYDRKGRLTSRNVAERTTSYEYDRDDNLILEINPLGQKTQYTYDLVAKKPKEVMLGDSKSSFVYDGYGRTLSQTDPLSNTTSYTYTAHGKPSSISHPDGTQETLRYYKNGLLKEHKDRGGVVTLFTYDSFGRMTKKEWADGEERWSYNASHLLSYTDRMGYTTTYSYDGAGRKISEEKCGRRIAYTYDSLGGLATVMQGGIVTATKRDLLGRVIFETKNDLLTKSIAYDPEGNEHIVTVGEKTDHFFYDPHKRLIKHEGALGEITTISYKEDQVLEKTTVDPSGLHTIEMFDIHDRLVEKRLEKRGTLFKERFTYDLAGNLLLHEEDVFEGTEYKKTLTRSYTYDVCNRRISSTVSDRTTVYTYTTGGKVATKTKYDGTVLTYTYTPLGAIETLNSSKGDIAYRFIYDKSGRLFGGNYFRRKLDPFGNVLEENFNGLTLFKTYDDLDRLISLTLPGLSPITYTYDLYLREVAYEGQKRTYDSYRVSGELLQESNASYTRDIKGQVLELVTPHFTQKCSYDPLGNPLTIGSTVYNYSPLSQILSEKDPIYSKDYRFNSHYDDLEQEERKEPNDPLGKYDSLDRLIECNGYTYTYDPLDRRLSKRKETFFSFQEERFVYDGFEEIASYNNTTPNAVKIGPPSRPSFFLLEGVLTVALYDAKGSLKYLIDPKTKNIQNSYLFDAFGNPIEIHEELSNPWRYALKHHDPESNLVYFGKRYYNPSTKQWITEDPAGDIDTLNLYAFLRNNPLRYVDYIGLLAEDRWNRFDWAADRMYSFLSNPYFQGGMQTWAGMAEFSCGAALTYGSAGFAAPLGFAMMAHASDHIFTGMKTICYGEKYETATSTLLQKMGMPRGRADFVDSGLSLLGMTAGAYMINNFCMSSFEKTVGTFTEVSINRPATSSITSQLLKNKLIAHEISGGHAFEKHIINQREFTGLLNTRNQFAQHIETILNNPTEMKLLTRGRTGYWDQKSGTVVIRDPCRADGGTAFRPVPGKKYYDEILK